MGLMGFHFMYPGLGGSYRGDAKHTLHRSQYHTPCMGNDMRGVKIGDVGIVAIVRVDDSYYVIYVISIHRNSPQPSLGCTPYTKP